MSVRAAHDERKQVIKQRYPDIWAQVFADRSRLPSIFWVYKFFRKLTDKEYGSLDGIDAYKRAEVIVSNFNETCQNENPSDKNIVYAKIEQTETGETVVAIADPFMRRVHEVIPQSGEIIMMDATSNLGKISF